MKKVILLAMLMPLTAFGQIIENFESGSANNWIQSTQVRWKADSISAISGKYSLHHIFDNPVAGIDRIGVPVKNLHPAEGSTKWSFLVRHGYNPSSSNNWSAFLMSDTDPATMTLDGSTNGFAIGVNLSGSDDTLRLWKIKGSVLTTVLSCKINWETLIGTATAAKIIVERTPEGNWSASVYKLNGILISANSGTDKELFNSAWFAVWYKYSSTGDRLLWIDDVKIEGNFYEDNEPPVVTGCISSGKNSVEISFNEEPSAELMIPGNFSLNTTESKSSFVTKIKALTYRIEFGNNFINRALNKLIISKICDRSGNCAQNIVSPFTPVWAMPGDVLISEIMADPVPTVSLPAKVYLELTNRTEYAFNLKNWRLSSDGQNELFPDIIIQPSGIVILCMPQDTSLFLKYGKVIGLKGFPTLTGNGKILCLSDSSGTLIHGVEYSSEWYGDELKAGGGWSLEMIDTRMPFYDEGNWTASASRKGGTPGSVNASSRNNQDISFSGIENVFPDDSVNISIRFSEPLLNLQGMIKDIKIDGKDIKILNLEDPLYRGFSVQTELPLTRGEVHKLEISEDIQDFAGNKIQKRSFTFGLPENIEPGDILFNELLFNPLPGDPDYLELYNKSEKIIDASRLQLVSVSIGTGDTSQIIPVCDEKRCILPKTYYAITIDKKRISDRYFSTDPEHLFQVGSLPSMADAEGHLVLLNRELDLIDRVRYNEKMHFSLLAGYEGVALEKIRTTLSSEDPASWHSASESSGWGTPGAINSVNIKNSEASDIITFSSSKITPDNDGNEDFLVIGLGLKGNDNIVSVVVFDETGNQVKKIASNMLAGPEASLIWDGTSDDGTLMTTGIYIVLITIYDDTGKTKKRKKVCTVIR
ncbi:MAG TPA: gliding motility-associated C-terminal domain-containing protein [Bacteroidales bacterium]